MVHGHVDTTNLQAVHQLLEYITHDDFLKLYVTEIIIDEQQQFSLFLRTYDFEVVLGTLENLNKKMNNLKAFYHKAKNDKLLQTYKKVNLQFDQQVVCTKL